MLRKGNWDKTLQKSLKFSDCRKSIRKQIRPSCRKNLSTSFGVCLVSWKQRNLEIRANIHKSCRRPVVSLLYATKSAFTAPIMLGMRTCLPCHIPDWWSRNANRIWPDLAFCFLQKRSGHEIKLVLHFVRHTIGLKNSRQFFTRSEVKPKPILTHSHTFSRAFQFSKLHFITWSFDWFTVLCVSFVIG